MCSSTCWYGQIIIHANSSSSIYDLRIHKRTTIPLWNIIVSDSSDLWICLRCSSGEISLALYECGSCKLCRVIRSCWSRGSRSSGECWWGKCRVWWLLGYPDRVSFRSICDISLVLHECGCRQLSRIGSIYSGRGRGSSCKCWGSESRVGGLLGYPDRISFHRCGDKRSRWYPPSITRGIWCKDIIIRWSSGDPDCPEWSCTSNIERIRQWRCPDSYISTSICYTSRYICPLTYSGPGWNTIVSETQGRGRYTCSSKYTTDRQTIGVYTRARQQVCPTANIYKCMIGSEKNTAIWSEHAASLDICATSQVTVDIELVCGVWIADTDIGPRTSDDNCSRSVGTSPRTDDNRVLDTRIEYGWAIASDCRIPKSYHGIPCIISSEGGIVRSCHRYSYLISTDGGTLIPAHCVSSIIPSQSHIGRTCHIVSCRSPSIGWVVWTCHTISSIDSSEHCLAIAIHEFPTRWTKHQTRRRSTTHIPCPKPYYIARACKPESLYVFGFEDDVLSILSSDEIDACIGIDIPRETPSAKAPSCDSKYRRTGGWIESYHSLTQCSSAIGSKKRSKKASDGHTPRSDVCCICGCRKARNDWGSCTRVIRKILEIGGEYSCCTRYTIWGCRRGSRDKGR